MSHLPLIASRLFGAPLLVHEGKLRAIVSGLGPRFGVAQPMAYDDEYDRPRPARRAYAVTQSGVALIPVLGVLANRTGRVDASSAPMRGYDALLADVRAAMTDPDVKALVLDMESPGGEAFGCFDATAALHAMRGGKPIIASANAYAYSAAYAIASAADLIFVPSSGEVGSIGVVAMHVDQSAADAKAGLSFEYIIGGAHKVDGNPHEPLTDDARAELQGKVANLYEMFVGSVAANRKIDVAQVRATEARCLSATEALSAGLADRIGTLADAIAEAETRASTKQPNRGRTSPARTSILKGSRMDENEIAAAREAAAAEASLSAARTAAAAEATAHAAGIMDLCNTYGRPQDASAHIKAGRSRGEVAEALLAARAADQAALSAAHPVGATVAPSDPNDPDGWNASTARVCGKLKGA